MHTIILFTHRQNPSAYRAPIRLCAIRRRPSRVVRRPSRVDTSAHPRVFHRSTSSARVVAAEHHARARADVDIGLSGDDATQPYLQPIRVPRRRERAREITRRTRRGRRESEIGGSIDARNNTRTRRRARGRAPRRRRAALGVTEVARLDRGEWITIPARAVE